MSIWEPFTERGRRSIVRAQEEAQRLRSNVIGTEHMLLGIISEAENVAAKVLEALGLDLAKTRAAVEAFVERGAHGVPREMVFTPRAKRVIELAFEEARQLNHNYIGTEHLLLGLIREEDGVAARVLKTFGVGLANVRKNIVDRLESEPLEQPSGARSAQVRQGLAEIRPRSADPSDRMTIATSHAIVAAKEAAMRRGRRIYDAEHLLYGIAHVEESPASQILAGHRATPPAIRDHLGTAAETLELSAREIEPSPAVATCIQNAHAQSASTSRLLLEPEMLLYALIDGTEHRGLEILKTLGADVDRMRAQLKEVLYGRNS